MFNRKYTITILDSKWKILKNKIKLDIIPRKDEYLFIDNQYYEIINIVHYFNNKVGVFLIVNPIENIFENK